MTMRASRSSLVRMHVRRNQLLCDVYAPLVLPVLQEDCIESAEGAFNEVVRVPGAITSLSVRQANVGEDGCRGDQSHVSMRFGANSRIHSSVNQFTLKYWYTKSYCAW